MSLRADLGGAQTQAQENKNKFYKIQLIEAKDDRWIDPATFDKMKFGELKAIAATCKISTKSPNGSKAKILERLREYMAKNDKPVYTMFTRWGRVGDSDATHE